MPGPPRKPTALKLVTGTHRKSRAVHNEVSPKIAMPKPPRHLGKIAIEEWNRLIQELHDNGLMTNFDRAALAAYCDLWASYVEASDKMTGKDMVSITAAGNLVENPYFSIKKRCLELMHKFLIEFGMTPAARTKISAPLSKKPSEEDNPEEKKYFG